MCWSFHLKKSKIFITYGDDNFRLSLKRIRKEAYKLGIFDKVIVYTPKDVSNEIEQSPLMANKRGGGYWLWKPYVIWKTMQKYPNAIVVYADAGCTLNRNYEEWNSWFEIMKSVDTLLTHYRPNVDYGWSDAFKTSSVKISTWTKRQTIDYFDERFENTDWHNFNKLWGGFVIAKNNSPLIRNWLDIMLAYPELVSDPEDQEWEHQYEGFCAHRHDQSIITPLAYWFEQKEAGIVKIIPETAESSNTSAVVASRIKDENKPPLKTRLIFKIKSIIGEEMYRILHFWK